MIITGIDSDLNGGIVTVDFANHTLIRVNRIPVTDLKKGRALNGSALHQMLELHYAMQSLNGAFRSITIESAVTMPQKAAGGPGMTKGIGTAHQTFGGIRALSEAVWGAPNVTVAWPSAWKRKMGLSSDKQKSLDMAAELFPSHMAVWSVKKNHGIAEALLLAKWHWDNNCTRVHSGLTNANTGVRRC